MSSKTRSHVAGTVHTKVRPKFVMEEMSTTSIQLESDRILLCQSMTIKAESTWCVCVTAATGNGIITGGMW